MKIAIVSNSPDQTGLMRETLTGAGHACHLHAGDHELPNQLRRDDIDLLVMDWQLAGLSGFDSIRAVHNSLPSLPVLLLVGRGDEDDVVAALSAGATDYQVKPLRRGELVMRVQALLKRAYPEQLVPETVHFGRYLFDISSARVAVDGGVPVELTQKEFALALLFFRNLGRPLSRAYIQENIWSHEPDLPTRTMDTHVSRVRNKLGLRPENGFRLAPVYSYGYRLEQLAG